MDQKTETRPILSKFGIEIEDTPENLLQLLFDEAVEIQTLTKLRSTLTFASGGDTIKKAERALNSEINRRVNLLATNIVAHLKKSDEDRKE